MIFKSFDRCFIVSPINLPKEAPIAKTEITIPEATGKAIDNSVNIYNRCFYNYINNFDRYICKYIYM